MGQNASCVGYIMHAMSTAIEGERLGRRRIRGYPWSAIVCSALALLGVSGCRDLSIPPPPSTVVAILRACPGSTVQSYVAGKKNLTADDAAGVVCQMDEKLDAASLLPSTAATVCAHALNAYAGPLPQTVSAIRTDGTGQATCARSQNPCGYAFFIKQKDTMSTNLELLGPQGCSVPTDATRGVLFACCIQPGPPATTTPPVTPKNPTTGKTNH